MQHFNTFYAFYYTFTFFCWHCTYKVFTQNFPSYLLSYFFFLFFSFSFHFFIFIFNFLPPPPIVFLTSLVVVCTRRQSSIWLSYIEMRIFSLIDIENFSRTKIFFFFFSFFFFNALTFTAKNFSNFFFFNFRKPTI